MAREMNSFNIFLTFSTIIIALTIALTTVNISFSVFFIVDLIHIQRMNVS